MKASTDIQFYKQRVASARVWLEEAKAKGDSAAIFFATGELKRAKSGLVAAKERSKTKTCV